MHMEKVVNIVHFIQTESYKANYTGKNFVKKEITYLHSINSHI